MRLSRRLRFSSFVRCLDPRFADLGTKRAPRALYRLSSTLTAMGLALIGHGPVAQVVRAHA